MAWCATKLRTGLLRLGAGLVVCLFASLAVADQNARDPLLEQALMLADNGHSADAIAMTEKALGQARTDEARWHARETLATIVHLDGRDTDALPLLEEVLASGEALFGPDDPALVYPLRMLAATQGNLGDDAAVTRTMLRSLRLTRTLAQTDFTTVAEGLLAALSDLARHYLDTDDNLAAALLAAELTIQSQNGTETGRPEAIEGELLRALAHLRMGRPVEAASHVLAAWQLGDAVAADADLSAVLDAEFADQAGAAGEARIAQWVESAASVEAERRALETAASDAAEPMLAALTRGDPIAADLAARSAFDRTSADDPLAVMSYFALMTGTHRAGRTDLAATWAARLAEMPTTYLASFAEDPSLFFQEIAEDLLSEGRAGDAAQLTEATINLATLRGRPQDVAVQNALTLYGAALRDMGESARAETALMRAIEIGAASPSEPPRDRATLRALGQLAWLFLESGKRAEATAQFERAVVALESGSISGESDGWLFILEGYLPVLVRDGQGAHALALAQRAVQVANTETGGAVWAKTSAQELLARTHLGLGNPAAAIAAADQAISLARADSRQDATAARIIAATAQFQLGDAAAANAMLSSVVSGTPDSTLLVHTAIEYANTGQIDQARQILARAMTDFPADSPVLPYLTAADGLMLLKSGDLNAALDAFRAATLALTQPDRRAEPRSRDHLPFHVDTALKLAETASGVQSLNFATEAFQVAQRVNDISAGAALGQTAARLRATSPEAETKVREMDQARQVLATARDALLARLAAGKDATAERAQLDRARQTLGQAGDALTLTFPQYRAFADPKPLDLVSVTRLLRPDEVLVLFATSDMDGIENTEPSVVMALTAEGYLWAPLPPRAEIAALAMALRCAAALTDRHCGAGAGATRGAFSLTEAPEDETRVTGFDYTLAYRAYAQLLEPVSAAFEGKTSLIIVPDKALAALPAHLMLTEPPDAATSPRDAPWLIRKMAVSIAPTVSSWAALRDKAMLATSAEHPFLGVGDPLIGIQRDAPVPVDCGRYTEPVLLSAALSGATGPLLRDASAARAGAVAALPALPETRCELAATSAFFGAGSQLLLQGDATEAAIKSMSLSGELEQFRVLSFATHGLLAGELGENQAGLVLTPPQLASPEDDGILTIEEIAGLRINADFVLLSACNTAAGSRAVDDSLSGLASAFFLAGARSLLVSHWPVYSDAAARLTTGMFAALSANPDIGHSEALRRSMLSLLDDPASDAATLHPAYWAPFMIVGDG